MWWSKLENYTNGKLDKKHQKQADISILIIFGILLLLVAGCFLF